MLKAVMLSWPSSWDVCTRCADAGCFNFAVHSPLAGNYLSSWRLMEILARRAAFAARGIIDVGWTVGEGVARRVWEAWGLEVAGGAGVRRGVNWGF